MSRVFACTACALAVSMFASAQPGPSAEAGLQFVASVPSDPVCNELVPWRELLVRSRKLIGSREYHEAGACLLAARDRVSASANAEDRQRLAATYAALGSLRRDEGRYGDAEVYYLRSISAFERAGAGADAGLVRLLNDLASLYLEARLYGKSQRTSRRSIEIQASHANAGAPVDVAQSRINLGAAERALGNDRAAETAYLEAEEVLRTAGLLGAPETTSLWNNLAVLYANSNAPQKARVYIQRAFAATSAACTRDTAISLTNLGLISGQAGLLSEADAALRQAAVCADRAFGPNHPQTAEVLARYASHLRKTKRKADAVQMERRVRQIRANSGDRTPAYTVDTAELQAANRKAARNPPR